MWNSYNRERENFNIVMNILESHFKGKVTITEQKFSAGYYIIRFDFTENLTEDDRSILRFMGCEETVERELTPDEQMFEALVDKHNAYNRLRLAQMAYEKALKAYKELKKRHFAQSDKES